MMLLIKCRSDNQDDDQVNKKSLQRCSPFFSPLFSQSPASCSQVHHSYNDDNHSIMLTGSELKFDDINLINLSGLSLTLSLFKLDQDR